MFGLFGGRSLGIDTGTFDPMQWRRQFGVDVEHIDQLEIIRRAEMVKAERTQHMIIWLADNTACIEYDGKAGRVTNNEAANELLSRKYREGWTLDG